MADEPSPPTQILIGVNINILVDDCRSRVSLDSGVYFLCTIRNLKCITRKYHVV
jgi:hypothetical protein